jgi:hypothetical protein
MSGQPIFNTLFMSKNTLALLFSLFLFACTNLPKQEKSYEQVNLSETEKLELLYEMIRYIGKLPGKADHQTKFDVGFDAYYRDLAKAHRLEKYVLKEKEAYYLVSRVAPSIYQKRVAIGGKLRRNEQGEIVYFEEIFRTWKMVEEELERKSEFLFFEMLEGKPLDAYYPEQSPDEEYIEFPNRETHYDTLERRWKSLRENPMEFYYQIEKTTEG